MSEDYQPPPKPPAPYLNAYPSRIAQRSRVKTTKDFLESGHKAISLSEWVRSMRYHKQTSRLFVEFKGGALGYYHNVPERTAAEFFTAPSHGKFVHRRLKGHFPFVLLRG